MFMKCDVNGPKTHEIYKFLRLRSSLFDPKTNRCKEIPWNFAKFIVSTETGEVDYHGPQTDPNSLLDKIEAMLSAGAQQEK